MTASADMIVAFVGLGRMGLPMARRLLAAGFELRGCDSSPAAREALAGEGADCFASVREAADGADVVVTMLPDGAAVRAVLVGAEGAAPVMRAGGLVIDMSSSAPLGTQALGEELEERGLRFIDAPVSGGVKKAKDGTLAILAGGSDKDIARARPLLEAMGQAILHAGPVGSGHAVKALNNYVSAAGLTAACEAVLIGERFGVAPEMVVDVLNASTGRNNSTELKLKPFVLSGTFASGFSMALMTKDLRTAAELVDELGMSVLGAEKTAALWSAALAALGQDADHTEIFRFLQGNVKTAP